MVFIRPVALGDLDQLFELAGRAGVGLTTLPKDRDLLRKRILKSQRSLENMADRPGGETYLLVMQDAETNSVVGASGIVSKVGGFEPFYAYRIMKELYQSDVLKVRKEVPVLHLVREHDGPAEIGSLFLSPDYRGKDNGRLLQLVRFLFVAEHREAFEEMVVSELRGIIDDSGKSLFWEAVGRHFFDIDFPKADHLSVVNKRFIADLMPRHPLYVPLLPAEAQAVIGRAHESSKPAQKNLEAEGFRFNGMVDIFDAGPCVACKRDEIRTVRDSRTAVIAETVGKIDSPVTYMIGFGGKQFRACMGPLEISDAGVRITSACAEMLLAKIGDTVRFATLRAEPTKAR